MANIWEKVVLILVGHLNSGRSYLIITAAHHPPLSFKKYKGGIYRCGQEILLLYVSPIRNKNSSLKKRNSMKNFLVVFDAVSSQGQKNGICSLHIVTR